MLKSIEYLFDFIDDLPIGIASADTTGGSPNHYNKFFLEMFGWDTEEIDTLEKWFRNAYPDERYRTEVIRRWEEMIEDAESKNEAYSYPIEVKVACKDGSYKWCEGRYYRKGSFIYGIFVDVSNRKQAEEKLHNLALIDPLTEIYNRRFFNINYYDRWNLSKRTRTPLSIIICDVDDFKVINDTCGHLAGDQVLIALAKAISATLKRSTEFVARYGGEEFVIVSYDCDESAALDLGRLIKNSVDRLGFPEIEGISGCTMSYGVATIVADASVAPEEFINRADEALYEAKRAGKNRIEVYPAQP